MSNDPKKGGPPPRPPKPHPDEGVETFGERPRPKVMPPKPPPPPAPPKKN